MEIDCAIAVINSQNVKGIVIFDEQSDFSIKISFDLKALNSTVADGLHGCHIHEYGDTSNGCLSMGEHYNPYRGVHGGLNEHGNHAGDLGNISFTNGICKGRVILRNVRLEELIGRGLVIHEFEDDLGRGSNLESKKTGNSGGRIACGVIAISK